MNKYQVFIDVPQDGEWLNIVVETMEIEAENCVKAEEKAIKEAIKLYGDCYVWQVNDEDKL